jgi:hypothetical protein
MRKRLWVIPLVTMMTCALCEEKITVQKLLSENPMLRLNHLDVPCFTPATCPLKDIKSFTLTTNFAVECKKKMSALIDRELATIGTLVNSKEMVEQGLMMIGSTNHLFLHVGEVLDTEGNRLPLTRINLCLETSVHLSETKLETRPRVWSINAFVAVPFDEKLNEKVISAVQKVVKEFTQNYSFANKENRKKPSFYCMY